VFKIRNIIIAAAVIIGIFAVLNLPKDRQNSDVVAQENKPTQTESAVMAEQLYSKANDLRKEGEHLKARETYQSILANYSDFENIERVQTDLEDLNMDVIFSNAQTANTVIHEVISGDTLGEIAKKHGTTIDLIKRNNRLKNDVIRVGQKLRVWTGKFNIYVDKSQNILMLKMGDEVLKVYDVSTGEGSSTPVGTFKITTRLTDPVWFNRGVVVPPESPENVLGSRWLGFDTPGYGIHGTVEPETIGQQVTAGCVRMRNSEVEELYSIIPMGTQVVIVD